MDILTHGVVGAVTGAAFGRPILGAAVAVLPDIVLGLRRRAYPTHAYNTTHSLPFVAFATLLAGALGSGSLALLVALCLLSHIVLDLPTHGKDWAPPLLYPFSLKRNECGEEWEWFNDAWFTGLFFAVLWCICLLIVVLS